jgi:hypothetical protein
MSDECNIARRHFNEVDKLHDDELQFIALSLTYMLLAERNGKCRQEWTFCVFCHAVISLMFTE